MKEWRDVVGHPGYRVSSEGDVTGPKGLLKPLTTTDYPRVCLRGRARIAIHQLVAAAFLGDAAGRDVNHLDGDKANPKLSNLEYCTRSENMKHAFRIGLQSNAGECHSQAKLDNEKVFEIRRLLSMGRKQSEVAAIMNVHQSAISRANSGKRWAHLPAHAAVGA